MADPTDEREGSGPGDGWHNVSQKGVPPVAWDANNKCFVVTLKGVALHELDDPHAIGVQVQFRPPVLYDVRVREKGSTEWGVGFIVPMNSLGFSGWKPDTDYEVMIRQVDKSGNIVSDSKPYLSGFHSPKANE